MESLKYFMDFRLIRQIRWASIVVQFAGLGFGNWPLIILGTVAFLGSYMLSLQAIEQFYIELEKAADAEEEKSETEKESKDDS